MAVIGAALLHLSTFLVQSAEAATNTSYLGARTEPSGYHRSGHPYIFYHDATGNPRMSKAIKEAATIWNRALGYRFLVETRKPPTKGITVAKNSNIPRGGLATTCVNNVSWEGSEVCTRSTIQLNDDSTRISSHEFGHTLGLEHAPRFQCSALMIGRGTSHLTLRDPDCDYPARPNTAEVQAVKELYRLSTATKGAAEGE